MDDDLINKAKAALMSRVNPPSPGMCNIVIPIPDHCAEKLIELFGTLIKREDYGTPAQKPKIND